MQIESHLTCAAAGALVRDLVVRSIEVALHDTQQRTRDALTAKLAVTMATTLHALAPLDMRCDLKLGPLQVMHPSIPPHNSSHRLSVGDVRQVAGNVQHLAASVVNPPQPRTRRRSRMPVAPVSEFDKVFPTLPFECDAACTFFVSHRTAICR